MALAFLLGLLIATAGTATAARLITGKQIKDGTITKQDLAKALQRQLAKTGAAGGAGPQGLQGAPGQNGAPGTPGAPGQNGAPGSAVAYASIASDGTLIPERSAQLIGAANVVKSTGFASLYCFSGLPVSINAVTASTISGTAGITAVVGYGQGLCPAGTQFFVRTVDQGGILANGAFTVVVN